MVALATAAALASLLNAGLKIGSNLIPFFSKNKSKYTAVRHPALSPELRPLLEHLTQLGTPEGLLGRQAAGDPAAFGGLDQSVLDEFTRGTVPSLLQSFSNTGLGSSSALRNTLGQATRGTLSDLARERFQRSLQARNSLLNVYNSILSHPYTQTVLEPKPFTNLNIGGDLSTAALLSSGGGFGGGGFGGGGLGGLGGFGGGA